MSKAREQLKAEERRKAGLLDEEIKGDDLEMKELELEMDDIRAQVEEAEKEAEAAKKKAQQKAKKMEEEMQERKQRAAEEHAKKKKEVEEEIAKLKAKAEKRRKEADARMAEMRSKFAQQASQQQQLDKQAEALEKSKRLAEQKLYHSLKPPVRAAPPRAVSLHAPCAWVPRPSVRRAGRCRSWRSRGRRLALLIMYVRCATPTYSVCCMAEHAGVPAHSDLSPSAEPALRVRVR